MNKKIIIGVIAITAIALAGLVGLQVYWIHNAVNLRKANFRRSVDEAMFCLMSVYRLERLETANQIKERMFQQPKGSSFMNTMDSITLHFSFKELDSYCPWLHGVPDSTLNFSGTNVRMRDYT
ncbi:MAG: hypothetical protein U5L09_13715 [Bacteroidales bacterium]|nr:hypothetical protein [Bacteroidales bacterium]